MITDSSLSEPTPTTQREKENNSHSLAAAAQVSNEIKWAKKVSLAQFKLVLYVLSWSVALCVVVVVVVC